MTTKTAPSLSMEQQKFLDELLSVGSVGKAAEAVGIHRRTATRWLKQPAVSTTLHEMQMELLTATSRRLAKLNETAVDQLEAMLANESTSPMARLKAIDLVITRGLKVRETLEYGDRIAKLEDRIDVDGRRRER